MTAILIGLGVTEVGIQIYDAWEGSESAQSQADQQKQQDQLNQYNQIQNINALQTQQARTLANYQSEMQTQEQSETEGEQSAYASAFSSIGTAEEQIGSQQVQAAQGASEIVSNAAARGIKVGPGAVQSAGVAGQGSQLSMEQGENGQAAVAGTVAKTAESAQSGTDPATVASDSASGISSSGSGSGQTGSLTWVPATAGATDSASGITGQAGSQVTPAVAATPAQLSVTPGTTNIYDSASSPLAQLAAYERNANLQIGQEESQVAVAGNAQLTGIANQAATFETGQQQQLLAVEQSQEDTMESAYLGLSQSESAMTQNEAFTQQNLSTYDTSLWLNAFSNILSTGATAFGKMYTPPTYTESEPEYAYDLDTYADMTGQNMSFDDYYSPGGG